MASSLSRYNLFPLSSIHLQTAVVFVRADASFDCVVDPSIWPRPSILWELPSGVQMAAVLHAHHIPKRRVDAKNITDSKTILMKPLDSQHSVQVSGGKDAG